MCPTLWPSAVRPRRVSASFTDPDIGDTHTFLIDTATDATKGKVVNNNDGTFTYDPNGAFTSLKAGATATDKFRYTVTDATGASSTATVTITITGQNDAPVAANVSATVPEHGPAATVTGSFTDPDIGDTHTFLIDTTTDATKGKVTNNGDGTFSYDPNGAFISLKAGATATDKFRYTVRDGSGAFSTAIVTITITGQNDAPVAANVAGIVSNQGPATTVSPSFTDPDTGDTHTFVIDTATDATKGQVTINSDGTFTYDPNGAFNGLAAGTTATDRFRYTVVDGSGERSTATVTMTIVVGPPAPIVTAIADLAAATEIKGTAKAGTTVKVYRQWRRLRRSQPASSPQTARSTSRPPRAWRKARMRSPRQSSRGIPPGYPLRRSP